MYAIFQLLYGCKNMQANYYNNADAIMTVNDWEPTHLILNVLPPTTLKIASGGDLIKFELSVHSLTTISLQRLMHL